MRGEQTVGQAGWLRRSRGSREGGLLAAAARPLGFGLLVFGAIVATSGALHCPRAWGQPAEAATPRAPWTTSRIRGSLVPPAPYTTERLYPEQTFANPVILTNAPGSKYLFLGELNGKLFALPLPGTAADRQAPVLVGDLRELAPGADKVYGLTFHPQFAENRYCYVTYILGNDLDDGTHVARFTMSREDPPRILAGTRQQIISWRSGGHNGGCIKFGPDGYLYISTGDAGPAFPPDPRKSGQDVSNLLSSILRIDVDSAAPYAIPEDNPFRELPEARGEVWAYGFRNPWKMSFDARSGDLWVGDVGWEMWEMIYRVERGGNYGWSLREGSQEVHRERRRGPTPVLPPTVEHSHTEARSITGGFVYHGTRLPELRGAYLYGDYVTGKVWALWYQQNRVAKLRELADTPHQIICFGQDAAGEVYLVAYDGTIHQLTASDAREANADFPRTLSETGLFRSVPDLEPATGVLPYGLRAEPWADGAVAERWLAIPGRASLGVHQEQNPQQGFLRGHWQFPPDTVLAKTLSLPLDTSQPARRRRLETQILHLDGDIWRAYNYLWNESQTDAVLAEDEPGTLVLQIKDAAAPGGVRQQTWQFASRTQCILCHTARAGTILGCLPEQVVPVNSPSPGESLAQRWHAQGVLKEPADVRRPQVVDPHDPQQPLEARVRSYLYVNCAHCHRRGGGGTAAMDVVLTNSLERTNLLGERPTQGTFGIHQAQVVAPGDPTRSVLFYRLAKLGRGRMPYFGSHQVDPAGLKLLHQWITGLSDQQIPEHQAWASQVELLNRAGTAAERTRALQPFLEAARPALFLVAAYERGQLQPAAGEAAVAAGARHPDPRISDLFERYLPESQRVKRLGNLARPAEILDVPGNASRGEQLMRQAGLQCLNCHQIGSQGKPVGPELSDIGSKRTRQQLAESLLEPSKVVEPKYVPYLVETVAGEVISGLVRERTESQVVLQDAKGQTHTIAQQQIERLVPQTRSLMPDLLLSQLTPQQAADLLEYLTTLKKPAPGQEPRESPGQEPRRSDR